MVMSKFEMITAVLSGSRQLELRVFCDGAVSVAAEQALTSQLCSSMNKKEEQWKRLLFNHPFSDYNK